MAILQKPPFLENSCVADTHASSSRSFWPRSVSVKTSGFLLRVVTYPTSVSSVKSGRTVPFDLSMKTATSLRFAPDRGPKRWIWPRRKRMSSWRSVSARFFSLRNVATLRRNESSFATGTRRHLLSGLSLITSSLHRFWPIQEPWS